MLRITSLLLPFLLKLVISFVSKVFTSRSVHSFHCNCFIRCIHVWFQVFSCYSANNELVLSRSFGNYAHEHVWVAEAVVSSSTLVAVIAAGSVGYLICRNLEKNVSHVHVYSMQQSTNESGEESTIRVDISKVFEEPIKPREFRTWFEV
ncbi:unnamed protein product [Trichobilharzia szidati]|nr:unnamed protein product [Trichobilharzia szidati]